MNLFTPRGALMAACGLLFLLAADVAVHVYSKPGVGATDSPSQATVRAVTRERGAAAALSEVPKLVQQATPVGVHQLTHTIGEELVRMKGSLGLAWDSCTSAYGGGCYHGAVTAALGDTPAKATSPANVCDFLADRSLDEKVCAHGVGHALATRSPDTQTALSGCDVLPAELARQCFDGVFMDVLFTLAQAPAGASNLNPVGFCSSLEVRYQEPCYFEVPAFTAARAQVPLTQVVKSCLSISELKGQRACMLGLGRNVRAQSDESPQKALGQCNGLGAQAKDCIRGVAHTTWDNFDYGLALCAQAPTAAKSDCTVALGEVARLIWSKPNERAFACTKVEVEYTQACIEGAQLLPASPPPTIKLP